MTAHASAEPAPDTSVPGGRIEPRLVRLTGSLWFWLVFTLGIAAYPVYRTVTRERPEPPPVLLALPAFSLTDQTGRPFGTEALRGRVWIANFIFTRCPTRCPHLSEVMAKIQRRLTHMGDAVALVSFSVDPEHDTPEKLAEYARRYQANPRRWRFLTGDLTQVEEAVVKGFKMPMEPGEPVEEGQAFDITHGTRLVLVDQAGSIRGFYEIDEVSVNQLVADLALLVNTAP